jgi:hypothetical protein
LSIRIALAVISLFIALLLFWQSYRGKRKLAKIWLLPAFAWFLSCITVVLDPSPPADITDTTQWQGIWFMLEIAVRGVVSIFTLIICVLYFMSPTKLPKVSE